MSNIITNQLSKEECRTLFDYDTELGVLRWKVVKVVNQKKVGDIAGTSKPNEKGYFNVRYDKKTHKLHNLIWNWHNGLIPEGKRVDHRVRKLSGGTDRIENLQILTESQNIVKDNRARGSANYIGVVWNKGRLKWRVCIRDKDLGKNVILGYFTDEIEAAKAYDEAALVYHGFYAKLNFPEQDPYWFNEDNERMSLEDRHIMQKAAH